MKTKLITSLALLLLTPQAMAYFQPIKYELPKVMKSQNFCEPTERSLGMKIDAIWFPKTNKILECYEPEDTPEWRAYSRLHEEAHAQFVKWFSTDKSDNARAKMQWLFDAYKKYWYEYPTEYASKNVDEFYAETMAMIQTWQFTVKQPADVQLKEAFLKIEQRFWKLESQ